MVTYGDLWCLMAGLCLLLVPRVGVWQKGHAVAMSSDLVACAELVKRGDHARFMAVMAAPLSARPVLFALFAFNVEVARAPWMTQQPMIAEMRLQWWCDALDEIIEQKPVRQHQIMTPLAALLGSTSAALLRDFVKARRWDIYQDPFEDVSDFERYIDQTSGHLLVAATSILGPADPEVVRDFGFALGLSGWFRAVPALRAQNRHPLFDSDPASVRDTAKRGLARLACAHKHRASVSKDAAAALLYGGAAKHYLTQAAAHPDRVLTGLSDPSPISIKTGLIMRSALGRW
jgi:phytoene synthase